jgi:hypothetical protein
MGAWAQLVVLAVLMGVVIAGWAVLVEQWGRARYRRQVDRQWGRRP